MTKLLLLSTLLSTSMMFGCAVDGTAADDDDGTEDTSTTEQGLSNGWHEVVWKVAGLYASPCGTVLKDFHAGHNVYVLGLAGPPECWVVRGGTMVHVTDTYGNFGYMRQDAIR